MFFVSEQKAERRSCKNMRILLIRHGDPDYVRDTLTEKGHREAALLGEMAQIGRAHV